MIDYFNAFNESYIPLNIEEGKEMYAQEMYHLVVDNYLQVLFKKDLLNITQGILEEDYKLLKYTLCSMKGTLA